ncbi:hypothetical protein BH23THE1_BH23THE1_13490 [soil metagenome]
MRTYKSIGGCHLIIVGIYEFTTNEFESSVKKRIQETEILKTYTYLTQQ